MLRYAGGRWLANKDIGCLGWMNYGLGLSSAYSKSVALTHESLIFFASKLELAICLSGIWIC
jgi:hypothetical protein